MNEFDVYLLLDESNISMNEEIADLKKVTIFFEIINY